MIRRIAEILLGILIVFLILGKYGDGIHPAKSLVAYITGNAVLQISIYILLIILAFRFIGGKSKDYSKFFYSLLVRLFGDPKKKIKP
ncbi:MAG TPA: hypothetical protein VFI29_00730 [Hanamia sp.]|nr:hypothetical protein [Hanamia sp.]